MPSSRAELHLSPRLQAGWLTADAGGRQSLAGSPSQHGIGPVRPASRGGTDLVDLAAVPPTNRTRGNRDDRTRGLA